MKLNLGCGTDIKTGWVNLDIAALQGVDVVHNIEEIPLPFGDNVFDEVYCKDILEHLEYIPVLKDINRIMKKGAVLTIRVPHFTSSDNFMDPTHKKMFAWRTFHFFTKDSSHGRSYYFDFYFEKLEVSRILFPKGLFFYNYFIEYIVNLHPKCKDFYEITGLSRLFPAQSVLVNLIK